MSMRRLTGNVAILAAAIIVGATSAMADYSRVEWIKGSGDGWIYTDYKPAATDKVVIKFKLAQVTSSNNEFLFCSRGTSITKNMFCGLRLGTRLCLDYGEGDTNEKKVSETPNTSDVYVMTLDGNAKTGKVETEGGTQLGSTVSWSSAVSPASSFLLFASHTLGSSLSASSTAFNNYGTFTLYSCKVYNSAGVMVRCWVPAVDDSVGESAVGHFGVLDLCNDVFWPCKGTTPFTAAEPIVVGTGETYSVTDSSVYRFRHYRFKIDNCMGERRGVQMSEFRLLNGDVDVTSLRSGFSYGEGMNSSTKSPITQVVDGDLNTKWYSANGSSSSDMSKCWFQLDFADPQPITAYDWATADDRWWGEEEDDWRDPMEFRLLGSNDGETWTELDLRNIGAKNITRTQWTGPYYALRNIGRVRLQGGVFEAQADIALSGVELHSGTMKIPTNRTVRIVSDERLSGVAGSLVVHGTLELQGTVFAHSLVVHGTLELQGTVFAHSLVGDGTVKGLSSGGDYVTLCAEAENNSAYNGRIAWMGGAGLLKAGGGALVYTGYALCDAPLVVENGVLTLADTTPCFCHWRFKVDDCMGGKRNGVQMSEFRLLNGDVDVTSLRSGFSYGEGMNSSEMSPITQVVDGDLNTKWYSANGSSSSDMSKCWFQLDFADPQPITAYDWATANDRPYVEFATRSDDTRDPAKFCLLGSDDGETWEQVSRRDIGSRVIGRKTWTGPYATAAHYKATFLRGGVLEVHKDVEFASVVQSGGEIMIPEGFTARLVSGGTWTAPLVASGSKGRIDVSAGTVSGAFIVSNDSDITLAASSLPGGVTLNGASSVTFVGNANIDGMAFHIADPKAASASHKVIVAAEGTITGEPVFTLGAKGYKVRQIASGGYVINPVGLMIVFK